MIQIQEARTYGVDITGKERDNRRGLGIDHPGQTEVLVSSRTLRNSLRMSGERKLGAERGGWQAASQVPTSGCPIPCGQGSVPRNSRPGSPTA